MGLTSLQMKQQNPILCACLFWTRESRPEIGSETLGCRQAPNLCTKMRNAAFLKKLRERKVLYVRPSPEM